MKKKQSSVTHSRTYMVIKLFVLVSGWSFNILLNGALDGGIHQVSAQKIQGGGGLKQLRGRKIDKRDDVKSFESFSSTAAVSDNSSLSSSNHREQQEQLQFDNQRRLQGDDGVMVINPGDFMTLPPRDNTQTMVGLTIDLVGITNATEQVNQLIFEEYMEAFITSRINGLYDGKTLRHFVTDITVTNVRQDGPVTAVVTYEQTLRWDDIPVEQRLNIHRGMNTPTPELLATIPFVRSEDKLVYTSMIAEGTNADPGLSNVVGISDVRFETLLPTQSPTVVPSSSPTISDPTMVPTVSLSSSPTSSTVTPTISASSAPTIEASDVPSQPPSMSQAKPPTIPETQPPTTMTPSTVPTIESSSAPSTSLPSDAPSFVPSNNPSSSPSWTPTVMTSENPTIPASELPSELPTVQVSASPTIVYSDAPSLVPSSTPTDIPTNEPSISTPPPTYGPVNCGSDGSLVCHHGGACKTNEDTGEPFCDCTTTLVFGRPNSSSLEGISAYVGPTCEVPITSVCSIENPSDPWYCANGGVCGFSTCICPPSFYGESCEFQLSGVPTLPPEMISAVSPASSPQTSGPTTIPTTAAPTASPTNAAITSAPTALPSALTTVPRTPNAVAARDETDVYDTIPCPTDTKLCPDGMTYVGRNSTTCEFDKCPPSTWGRTPATTERQPSTTCKICPPDECIQQPNMIYPDALNINQATCGEIEANAAMSVISTTGPTTPQQISYKDCAELQKLVTVDKYCGGCSSVGCPSVISRPSSENLSYGKFTSP